MKIWKGFGTTTIKYRYLIFGIINAIAATTFITMALLPPMNFFAGVFGFVVGYCWNKDTQRVLNGK